MTTKEITLFFVQSLLTMKEDVAAFARYKKNAKQAAIRESDPEKFREATRRWEIRNPDKKKANWKRWASVNTAYLSARDQERGWKTWKIGKTQTEIRKYFADWARNKSATDPGYKILCRIRKRIWAALKNVGIKKDRRALSLLGVQSVAEVWAHLEKQFRPGMTRENYGSYWEIDHIKPCASFNLTDLAQQRVCFHFSNLQPLTVTENRSKGAR